MSRMAQRNSADLAASRHELDLARITYPDYPGERLQCATIRRWLPTAATPLDEAASSDGALVGVAPSRVRVRVLEQEDDGMVGFFVVCFGVLAW